MEKNIASIYKITNIINGKIYIGFDTSFPKRIKQHYNDAKRGKNSPLCNDIRKYGWENFTNEVLYQSFDVQHCLKSMESYFIIEYNTFLEGYNQTTGGNGTLNSPRPKSEEWRKKHSERMKNNNPRKGCILTDEQKQNHSKKMKDFYKNNPEKILNGNKNPMFGKNHTDEWKRNHSEILKTKYKNGEIKKIEKVSCSFCDMRVVPGNLKRHENVCYNNPDRKEKKK
jgi:group I intron endonuclease